MQKNHIGGIHIAKKIALCIFLVSATLSAVPKSTFGATSSVFQVIQKESNDFDEKCHAGSNPYRNQSADGP